ncbi:MAG: hypothetical protein G01um101477_77 [Candidatus Doudnabacteria bacterium Gr01-1014_77]|uniref:KTSC domain-containing protein n=1 Tax=Candidatus Doudnabacteria bacterium Gr01-1014_77 TaxID=2017133 RepID=A0A554JDT6_9BACT|nr:MAG: hypothetical protein G01um101477_77 [Candidatus Doudnabacteria bacterium Gr01-1014_77]
MTDKKYPRSSSIVWYHYHPLDQRLEIKGTDGRTWLFHNVSERRFKEFESAPSLGGYMKDHFMLDKGKYMGEEMTEERDRGSSVIGI